MGQRDGRGLVSKKKMQVRVTHLIESEEKSVFFFFFFEFNVYCP